MSTPQPAAATPTDEPAAAASAAAGDIPAAVEQQQQQQSSTETAAAADTSDSNTKMDVMDNAVLDYLQKKGLSGAVLELTNKLKEEEAKAEKQQQQEEPSTEQSIEKRSDEMEDTLPTLQWGIPDAEEIASTEGGGAADEARAYLDSFVTLQLWVLSLPDGSVVRTHENPIFQAQALLRSDDPNVSVQSVLEAFTTASNPQQGDTSKSQSESSIQTNLPPSCKNELLSVTFALLVHTYCEMLEVGMESTAHMVRDAFRPVYEVVYSEQYRDLYQCTTKKQIADLNLHNSQYKEALSSLKKILHHELNYKRKREELKAQMAASGGGTAETQQQLVSCNRYITGLRQKYTEYSQKATSVFDLMQDLPFLRRARAVRWQLTLSHVTYISLSHFLNASDDSLLAMSTLLESKCELHVERRPPVPFVPAACVFVESPKVESAAAKLALHSLEIQWAAPTPRLKEIYKHEQLPFPKYSLDEEYDNTMDAKRDQRVVAFNRSLLIHGLRRLEAQERKREYDVLTPQAQKRLKEAGSSGVRLMANALEPSILLTTLCADTQGPLAKATSGSSPSRQTYFDVSTGPEEAGIGLCCAKLCEPDGRRVAVGCEDSAVRIWSAMDSNRDDASREPLQVLLGHKNGFPVFGVDWNRDGRSLLSCGGDGSIRLWDTMLTGPFGDTAAPNSAPRIQPTVGKMNEDAMVPELRPEAGKYTSGAALAVYKHDPSIPVWSVSFSPSGYYFASAGADATARLWVTDRSIPVRLLTGHTSSNVNCVEWHPNCNYILTGSDDCTARLW